MNQRLECSGPLAARLMALARDPDRIGELHSVLGEFCHSFRNRMHSLSLTLYLARRGGSFWAEEASRIEAHYHRIDRLIGQLQWVCRPSELKLMRLDLGSLLDERRMTWADPFASRGCALEIVDDPGALEGWFDPCRLATALDALAHWRAEVVSPGMIVEIARRHERGQFLVTWAEAGGSGGYHQAADDLTGSLALGILGRVMADHRGTLRLAEGDAFGVSLRWPVQGVARRGSRVMRPGSRSTLTGPASRA